MKQTAMLTAVFLMAAACGTTTENTAEFVQMTGSTQIMAVGTRSETVVFEDYETGERFALVGDLARELVPQYGIPVAITGVPTEEGFSLDPDLPKLRLVEYVLVSGEVENLD